MKLRKWDCIIVILSAAGVATVLWMLMPTIVAANSPKEDMQTYRSGYAITLYPKQSVNFSQWVGYQQIVKIDVNVQEQDREVHAVLTDSQGRMVLSKFFKGSLHETMRFGYFGPYAFVVSNGQDSPVNMQISLESAPIDQHPKGYELPLTLPTSVLPEGGY